MSENRPFTLVTGASSRIGRAIAVTLSHERRLILSGRRHAELEETRGQCKNAEQHRILSLDLAEPDRIEAELGSWLAHEKVSVEALVYCAGLVRVGPLRSFPVDEVMATMQVNFVAAAEISRLLLQRKINADALHSIVLISSVSAIRGVKGFSIYAATKGAIESFARSLAAELAPKVRVNTILAGAVETERGNPALLEASRANHPLGLGQPQDIAAAVCYLLSPEARWITGQGLVVDGGWSCR